MSALIATAVVERPLNQAPFLSIMISRCRGLSGSLCDTDLALLGAYEVALPADLPDMQPFPRREYLEGFVIGLQASHASAVREHRRLIQRSGGNHMGRSSGLPAWLARLKERFQGAAARTFGQAFRSPIGCLATPMVGRGAVAVKSAVPPAPAPEAA